MENFREKNPNKREIQTLKGFIGTVSEIIENLTDPKFYGDTDFVNTIQEILEDIEKSQEVPVIPPDTMEALEYVKNIEQTILSVIDGFYEVIQKL